MKTFVLILLISMFFSSSYGDVLDTLLQDYEKESELSNKTKDESAGNLIVYTRDDLERMQVESLKDILKSLRFFTYAENRIAQPDILNQDPIVYYSKSVRVYLNENELLTAITGSGLILFGDMEMDFIDHVEIYQGFPSFDFGVEPATIVIRLYTKTAEHDEGGRVKATFGSNSSNKENIYYANTQDDISYFIYANHINDNKDTYSHEGETLRRDKQIKRFYGLLSTQNHRLEVHSQEVRGDAFLGSFVGSTPDNTKVESSFINVATHSKFLDDTLTLNLSYIEEENDFSYRYDTTKPVVIPLPYPPFIAFITSLDRSIEEKAFTATLKKEWDIDSHLLSLGIQYRYKKFDLTDAKFNMPTLPLTQAYYREDVYSLFIQDLITLSDNHMISLSVMNQVYKRDGDVDNPNTLQLRLGYIYTNNKWVAKTFISRQEFASEPYMTISPYYGNNKLKKEIYSSIFQEFSYSTPSTLSKMILGYGVNKNIPILDQNFVIQNSDKKISGHSAALEFTLFFSEKDKLELQTSYTYIESPYSNEASKHYTHVIRMLNSVNKFDIFNELTIHSGYQDMKDGYDYTAGIKYAINKDFNINFKGENIFNSGLKRSYISKIAPVEDSVTVPIVERKFMLGMEYLF